MALNGNTLGDAALAADTAGGLSYSPDTKARARARWAAVATIIDAEIADALGPGATLLASNANGEGASLVGIEDAATKLVGATVEAALAELALSMGHSGVSAATEIAAGVLTVTGLGSALRADVEGGAAASDDLDTITGLGDGGFAFLTLNDAARNVVVKHGTGNILCPGGFDITLDALGDTVALFQMGANVNAIPWRLASLSDGGLGAALASAANGQGASRIAIEDAGTLITASTVEGALTENRAVANTALLGIPTSTDNGIYATPAPTALGDVSAGVTLTTAQILTGILTCDNATAGNGAVTLPAAADFVAAVAAAKGSAAAVGDSLEFRLLNLSAVGGDTATLTAGGATLVGNAVCAIAEATRFMARITNATGGTEAYSVYRV